MSMASSEKPAKPVSRFGIGFLTLMQVVCVALLLLATNYLASSHRTVKDLSGDAAYTLSSSTVHYLQSPAIQDRSKDDPITLLIAFKSNAAFYERLRALGEEYSRISGGRIKLELLDPVRSLDATERNITEYGSVFKSTFQRSIFTHDIIVVDARTKAERDAATTAKPKEKEAANAHVRFIDSESLVQYSKDEHNARKPVGYLAESEITTALLKAVEGVPRKLYYIADKSSLQKGGQGSAWANFEGVMQSRNLAVESINLAGLTEIPHDAAAVAIIDPSYDITGPEKDVLENYFSRPQAALLVTVSAPRKKDPDDDKEKRMPEVPVIFRSFLRSYGVTPRLDRVVAARGSDISTTALGQFTAGMDFTKDFTGQTFMLEGSTCSLEVRDRGADDLAQHKIQPYSLIETDKEGFWGEAEFDKGAPSFDPQTDNKPPLSLAAAVIRGNATSDELANKISRMVVISNTDFLDPKYFSAIHRDFLASSMDWMIHREQMAGVGPRSFGTYKLPLLDSQISFINRLNFVFLPLLAALIGAMVWASRRA